MAALDGLEILVPESRELDLFAAMLEAEGATAIRCPLVQILDLEDTAEADSWIDCCIQGLFDDVILLTGEGLRRLLTLSGAQREAFISALGRVRLITRGPKPARALREIGLSPALAAQIPTSDGVLAALASQDIKNRRIGAQIYPGDGAQAMIAALRARGASVSPVTPYRYASQADSRQVIETIHALAAGRFGLVAFTATPQIERLFAVAQEAGLDEELKKGLSRTPIAAIGPVVEETLQKHGLASALRPNSSFHLKPFVRVIATWRVGAIQESAS